MKNLAIRKYLVKVVIFTTAYLCILLIMDYTFNGTVVDYLFRNLPRNLFYWVWRNKRSIALIVYMAGLVLISVQQISKLSGLLGMVGTLIQTDYTADYDEKCPEELKEFSLRLKAFRQDLKMNEQARREAEQKKNDLIVYLAHDLKTPLTSIIGYLSLLDELPDLSAQQRAKYTGIALDKAYRLEQLINEFFEITRLNTQSMPQQKSKVNLTVLLLQIIMEFYPMLEEKHMQVVRDIESDIKVMGDADKLARVFDNLFRNAVNYGYSNSNIEICAQTQANKAVIKISNTGDEIPPEKLEHIFDKFFRIDSARQSKTGGAGLGLAIAKQIVELHNGEISAKSYSGKTEFIVMLPL